MTSEIGRRFGSGSGWLLAAGLLAGLDPRAAAAAPVALRPGELGSNTPICCQYPSRRVNACLEWADETYTLEARGHRPEKLTDEMGFAYSVVEGDFSFEVRLADAPELGEGCQYGNYGIAVRDDLVGNDGTVMLRYQRNSAGSDRWIVQYREQPTEAGANACAGECFIDKYSDGPFAGRADGMWLRLERSDGLVTASLSEDGAQWQALGAPMSFPQPEVYVGLFMACGNKGIAVARTVWDNLELSADGEPWGGTIGPGRAAQGCAHADEFTCDEKLGLPAACAYEGAPRAGYPEPPEEGGSGGAEPPEPTTGSATGGSSGAPGDTDHGPADGSSTTGDGGERDPGSGTSASPSGSSSGPGPGLGDEASGGCSLLGRRRPDACGWLVFVLLLAPRRRRR